MLCVVPSGFVDTLTYEQGTIKVLYGSATGPGARAGVLTQDSPGVPGTGQARDQFGYDLAAGDVDGDGYADIAAGVPYKARSSGAVVVLKGGRGGLSGTGARLFSQATRGVPGVAEARDLFGASVTLRDLDRDGKADLGVGAPGENGGAGAAWALPGSPGGPGIRGVRSFDPIDLQASDKGSRLGLWSVE